MPEINKPAMPNMPRPVNIDKIDLKNYNKNHADKRFAILASDVHAAMEALEKVKADKTATAHTLVVSKKAVQDAASRHDQCQRVADNNAMMAKHAENNLNKQLNDQITARENRIKAVEARMEQLARHMTAARAVVGGVKKQQ